jgi:hypothetical protein
VTISAGNAVKFVPGELQVEEAKQEAAETRLPTLPHLPAIDEYASLHPSEEAQQRVQASNDPGALEMSVEARVREQRTCSILEESAGFYLKCRTFLPAATPEQHFEVFGVSRPLNKEEWAAFVEREAENYRYTVGLPRKLARITRHAPVWS